jgi:Na+/H+ antiporter NhaD/arsenite permease-like protein
MTPLNIIKETFLASLTCMVVPTLIINSRIKGSILLEEKTPINQNVILNTFDRNLVFLIGVFCLLFVPFFKSITELPPYMGMLFSLGMMWVLTELMHSKKVSNEKGSLSVSHALRKIDTPSILFFLGILMSIAALEQVGLLASLATFFDDQFSDIRIIAIVIGLLSSVVDNVPMVAALQSMYSLDIYPTDHYFWEFLAYTAGTGGSVLIIGSAAGVAVMGIEKVDFFWYLKNISWIALIGFLSGALVFILQNA